MDRGLATANTVFENAMSDSLPSVLSRRQNAFCGCAAPEPVIAVITFSKEYYNRAADCLAGCLFVTIPGPGFSSCIDLAATQLPKP